MPTPNKSPMPPTTWPTWPFTRLAPAEMEKLLQAMKAKQLAECEDALL